MAEIIIIAFLFGAAVGQALTLAIGAWKLRTFFRQVGEHLRVVRIKLGASPDPRRHE